MDLKDLFSFYFNEKKRKYHHSSDPWKKNHPYPFSHHGSPTAKGKEKTSLRFFHMIPARFFSWKFILATGVLFLFLIIAALLLLLPLLTSIFRLVNEIGLIGIIDLLLNTFNRLLYGKGGSSG